MFLTDAITILWQIALDEAPSPTELKMKAKPNMVLIIVALLAYWVGLCNASAFYDPGMQRWLNRDPLGEIGGINLYEFYSNDLINRYDSFGLSTCKTCEEACAAALKDPSIDTSGGGGVICDGDRKCACFFGVPGAKPGECPELDALAKKHEEGHFNDVDCGSNPGLHRPSFKPGVDQTKSECALRKQSIKDLNDAIPKASAKCKGAEENLKKSLEAWVSANCGP